VRHTLPFRPSPSTTTDPFPNNNDGDDDTKTPLSVQRIIGMKRLGPTSISPDGTMAVFQVREYDMEKKKFEEQLWSIDLTTTSTSLEKNEGETNGGGGGKQQKQGPRKLTSGKDFGWSTVGNPAFSPCGKYVAFLSDRTTSSGGSKKTSVWILPMDGPGEARLLREFPVSVGDLEWTKAGGVGEGGVGGIIVSASVYVDAIDRDQDRSTTGEAEEKDPMKRTAKRDAALDDTDGKLGGLNAVLYRRLPIREWDRWLNAKMNHPFYIPVTPIIEPSSSVSSDPMIVGYECTANITSRNDLLRGIPTAVPSGAFGGSDDWSVSSSHGGKLAFSARPPLAEDEAWTTNRHIYLTDLTTFTTEEDNNNDSKENDDDSPSSMSQKLGRCVSISNPGYDTNPTFSPDGQYLAWLTMAGPAYEADAVGINIYHVDSGNITSLLKAEIDWEYSPDSLTWSEDGRRLYVTADVRSRRALAYIDVMDGNGVLLVDSGVKMITTELSTSVIGVFGSKILATVQSLTSPPELYYIDPSAASSNNNKAVVMQQLTHLNDAILSRTAFGAVEEIVYEGDGGEDVQAWFLKPAGFVEGKEGGYPLAVIYHGGPQGSTGDDWQYRWNLQYYASMGFAVLAPNFHGSTGFGHKFCRDISTDWGIGGRDTIYGVRHILSTKSWINPQRVVGLGASYGGYTSNWLNGNAPEGMFCALVCHCGVFDFRSSYYATEELFFMETEFGGPPYLPTSLTPSSPYQLYTPSGIVQDKKSNDNDGHISSNVQNWKTPTLVIHGAKDYRLVESEGISTFTALQRQAVPSELLYLPGENHHCLNPQNSMVWHETVKGWIKRWTTTETME